MNADLERLQRQLGYQFKDQSYLQLALTHRSASKKNNERLEFLGDAILNFVVARWLYEDFPQEGEGILTRMRAHLVCERSLAKMGAQLDLGSSLCLGPGELKSGGFQRPSILADAFEAIVGALFLDAGFECCQMRIFSWFQTDVKQLAKRKLSKDSKTSLQEYLQARKMALPHYQLMSVQGPPHNQIFTVHCKIEAQADPCVGVASARRLAEQVAAGNMLKALGVEFNK